ncbi:SGNH/GDSL hydrolase family protein [Pelagibacterales bacterium SAG-MED39]|nr:SGNH/GDSL hydrolase family protein [Pelagibacterales bacterium SAG-MED39]
MKYFTIIFSIIISLIFLESFSRIFIDDGMNYEIEMAKYANNLKKISQNRSIGIEHRKNVSAKLMGSQIILNDHGFRVVQKTQNNKKKILMLGDSMTFGWGAKKPFPNILNEKIENYEVLNAGIGNTNTIMQINNFFENFSSKFEYELIVLNFFINDFEDVKIVEPNFLQKYSYLYTFINNKINTILIKFNLKKDWQKFYTENYLDENIRNDTLKEIQKLNDYCNKNNINFIIHNIPELRDLNNYRFNNETNIIKKFAKKNKIYFIDSFNSLQYHNEEELWVTNLDPHANDKAHTIIADFLLKKISEIFSIN